MRKFGAKVLLFFDIHKFFFVFFDISCLNKKFFVSLHPINYA